MKKQEISTFLFFLFRVNFGVFFHDVHRWLKFFNFIVTARTILNWGWSICRPKPSTKDGESSIEQSKRMRAMNRYYRDCASMRVGSLFAATVWKSPTVGVDFWHNNSVAICFVHIELHHRWYGNKRLCSFWWFPSSAETFKVLAQAWSWLQHKHDISRNVWS